MFEWQVNSRLAKPRRAARQENTEGAAVIIRTMFIGLLLLGLLVAWCGQLHDTTHGMATLHIHIANEEGDPERRSDALQQAREAVESSQRLSQIMTFVGLAIVIVAGTGWLAARRVKPAPSTTA